MGIEKKIWLLLKDGLLTMFLLLLVTNLLYFAWRALIMMITAPLTALFTLNFNTLFFNNTAFNPIIFFTLLSFLSIGACFLVPKLYTASKNIFAFLLCRLKQTYTKLNQ